MKIYIPFNSNDFNSILTTLSISPAHFYPKRKYSFKRSTSNLIWKSEFHIIGFDTPQFHTKQFDHEDGYLINLEYEDTSGLFNKINNNGCDFYTYPNTLYLLNNFKFIFRKEDEKHEVFSKTLKSIETKFTFLAKNYSRCIDSKTQEFVNDLPLIVDQELKSKLDLEYVFSNERKLNRCWGAITGHALGINNAIPNEYNEFRLKLKSFKNSLTLYLNNLQSGNSDRSVINSLLLELRKSCANLDETIEQSLILNSDGLIASDIYNLKGAKIFGINIIELILIGLFNKKGAKLTLPLQIEKFEYVLNTSSYNSKYISSYISKITTEFDQLVYLFELSLNNIKSSNSFNSEDLVNISLDDKKLAVVVLPKYIDPQIGLYFSETLKYFIELDNIENVDSFFEQRESLLTNLGIHLANIIPNFKNSNERIYLFDLLNSFKSLRSVFSINSINNDVLMSIGVLFTTGRDLLQYGENCNQAGINPSISYSIWGAVYGSASLPKTLTAPILDNQSSLKHVLEAYSRLLGNELTPEHPNIILPLDDQNPQEKKDINSEVKSENINEPLSDFVNEPKLSNLGQKIKEIVLKREKIEIKELQSELNIKTQKEIKDLVKNELPEFVEIYDGKPTFVGVKKNKEVGVQVNLKL